MDLSLNLAFAAAFIGPVVYGAITDAAGLKIPNWISILLILLFALYLLLDERPISALQHTGVALAVLVVGFALFAAGYMGAGDVKLLTAIALWAGPSKVIAFIFCTALVGAGLALLVLAVKLFLISNGSGVRTNWIARMMPLWVRQGVIPYGVAICVGALVTVPSQFV